MSQPVKRWVKFALRWGIAVVGITWVVLNVSLWDRVMILDPQTQRPVRVRLAEPAEETSRTFLVEHPTTGEPIAITREQILTRPDRREVTIRIDGEEQAVTLLAVRPGRDTRFPDELLVEDPQTGQGVFIDPAAVVGRYIVRIPYPRVDVGLVPIVRQADPKFLWLAVLIFPVTFLVTSLRWHTLLRALNIQISLARTFVLNMVGAFYNSFMPGSTGGDVLKAYYAAKQTKLYRTRAVMSVLVDRIVGLLALVILGGSMAAYQWHIPECRAVAIACATALVTVVGGLVIFYTPLLRKYSGLGFVLHRLPMQPQVHKAMETMEIYRQRPVLVLGALAVTFPVHMTVITSAMLAGMAFGLPLDPLYYWVAVPVIVLSGSMPISPQGAGVMEFFAILLMRPQGATVSQALALTMSIRLVQMFWNLAGGIFVVRGGYHAPSEAEQHELEMEPVADPVAAVPKV